jgi:hypothetical protein
MIVRFLVITGIVAGTALMLLAWLVPTWPYDWAPPDGAWKDADLACFDLICASRGSLYCSSAPGRGLTFDEIANRAGNACPLSSCSTSLGIARSRFTA